MHHRADGDEEGGGQDQAERLAAEADLQDFGACGIVGGEGQHQEGGHKDRPKRLRKQHLADALAVAGCASMNPMTVLRLSQLDPLTADPNAIAVGLVLPKGLAVPPGGAKMVVTVQRDDTGAKRTVEAVLQQSEAVAGIALAEGQALRLFKLSAADAARLREMQQEVALWQAEVPKDQRHGSFSVGAEGCLTAGALDPDAEISILIRTEAGGDFLPLLSGVGLRQGLGDKAFDALGPCHGPT